uniref:Fibronectin type-III domain-containing protein n=1 Tax=Knipowitschia caucasica TaxID=637954 RepID=A0AAV2LRT9_KNICA
MIAIFLVFAKHGEGNKNCALQCEPQNIQLSSVNQDLELTWDSPPSCLSQKNLMFELEVLLESRHVHHGAVRAADHAGSGHSWRWTSSVPLECATHSIQIRSKCGELSSDWITETLPGLEPTAEIQVFPQDSVFEVGSRVTFCCIVPTTKPFKEMTVRNYVDGPRPVSTLRPHTYALTLDLRWPTPISDAEVVCRAEGVDENGALAVIGYRPTDRDLKCETRDFSSAECFWTVGHQIFYKPTDYWLLEQSCSRQTSGKCSQKVRVDQGEKNWTLVAQNVLGTIRLVDEADLTKRVRMYAPQRLNISSVNAKNVTLRWFWSVQQYQRLPLTCQIHVTKETVAIQVEKSGFGLTSVVITSLSPNRPYSVKVRCASESNFWKWGDWSQTASFHTEGDIPDALDVWTHREGNITHIKWKLLEDDQSHRKITHYEVEWVDSEMTEPKKTLCIVHPKTSVALNLSPFQKYVIFVTAVNAYGSSLPAQMIAPPQSPESPQWDSWRIQGVAGGFNLSWTDALNETCGYILDWCPVSGDCSVDWLKLPPNTTSAVIHSKDFQDGVRYRLSMYLCTTDAPMLLAVREGYTREQKIADGLFKNLRWEQRVSDVTISWDRVSLEEQSAFIKGYVMNCSNEHKSVQVHTENAQVSNLTVRNLDIDSYTFSVLALTSMGECGLTKIHVTLNPQSDNLISAFLISLFAVCSSLIVFAVVCYRQRACITRNVYPPIPEPVLKGINVPFPGVSLCPVEEPIVQAPVLYCPVAGSQEDVDKFSPHPSDPQLLQTLHGHNETPIPVGSWSPVSPNPSYALVQLGNNRTSDDALWDSEDGPWLSNFPRPQLSDFIDKGQNSDTISCVSNYIILPH